MTFIFQGKLRITALSRCVGYLFIKRSIGSSWSSSDFISETENLKTEVELNNFQQTLQKNGYGNRGNQRKMQLCIIPSSYSINKKNYNALSSSMLVRSWWFYHIIMAFILKTSLQTSHFLHSPKNTSSIPCHPKVFGVFITPVDSWSLNLK